MEMSVKTPLERYLVVRRWYEAGFALIYVVVNAAVDSVVTTMDIQRNHLPFQIWEAYVWAFTSYLLVLPLIPLVVMFVIWLPLTWTNWLKRLPWYVCASLVFCLIHVNGMFAARTLIYAKFGEHYDFGNWLVAMSYEYLKDVRAFFAMVILFASYRFILLRLQGEVKLLDEPDVGPAVDSVERPQRFLVRKLGKEFLINVNDIERLEAQGNYVNLHVRGRAYPLRSTMAAIESKLDPNKFVRVHRSHMIQLDHLAEIEPLDTGDARLKLHDGVLVPCSRNYRAALRERGGSRSTNRPIGEQA
jgi:hypothetical protein